MSGFIHILAPGKWDVALCGVVKPEHLGDPGNTAHEPRGGPWCEACYDRHALVELADTDLEGDSDVTVFSGVGGDIQLRSGTGTGVTSGLVKIITKGE